MAEQPDAVDVAEQARESTRRSGSPDTGRAGRHAFLRSAATVVVVLLAVVLIPSYVARVYAIPSGSMETTLHGCTGCENDRILVDKLTYRFGSPAVGDVVVFVRPGAWTNSELENTPKPTNPVARGLQRLGSLVGIQAAGETDLVKRVIAVGGQTVACCDDRNRITVDGKSVDEPYVYFAPAAGPAQQQPFAPVRVPEGQLWVMGDSRNNSVDSRAEGDGPVPVSSVIGKARLIVFPFGRFGVIGGR